MGIEWIKLMVIVLFGRKIGFCTKLEWYFPLITPLDFGILENIEGFSVKNNRMWTFYMNFDQLPKIRINGDLPKFWKAEALTEDTVVKQFYRKINISFARARVSQCSQGLIFETWKTADKLSKREMERAYWLKRMVVID